MTDPQARYSQMLAEKMGTEERLGAELKAERDQRYCRDAAEIQPGYGTRDQRDRQLDFGDPTPPTTRLSTATIPARPQPPSPSSSSPRLLTPAPSSYAALPPVPQAKKRELEAGRREAEAAASKLRDEVEREAQAAAAAEAAAAAAAAAAEEAAGRSTQLEARVAGPLEGRRSESELVPSLRPAGEGAAARGVAGRRGGAGGAGEGRGGARGGGGGGPCSGA